MPRRVKPLGQRHMTIDTFTSLQDIREEKLNLKLLEKEWIQREAENAEREKVAIAAKLGNAVLDALGQGVDINVDNLAKFIEYASKTPTLMAHLNTADSTMASIKTDYANPQ